MAAGDQPEERYSQGPRSGFVPAAGPLRESPKGGSSLDVVDRRAGTTIGSHPWSEALPGSRSSSPLSPSSFPIPLPTTVGSRAAATATPPANGVAARATASSFRETRLVSPPKVTACTVLKLFHLAKRNQALTARSGVVSGQMDRGVASSRHFPKPNRPLQVADRERRVYAAETYESTEVSAQRPSLRPVNGCG